MNVPELSLIYQAVGDLKTNPRNARTHSKSQIRQIAESIKAFRFVDPVLVDKENIIIAGHGRVQAAKLLGMPEVATIRAEHLTPDQIRAYMLAENRLAEKAGWDESILSIELQHLSSIEADFDVTVTGFEVPEIDLILSSTKKNADPDDVFEIIDPPQAVTRPGDLWELGRHRILCASPLDPASYPKLLGDRRAEVVIVDPPFQATSTANSSDPHGDSQAGSSELNESDLASFLPASLTRLLEYSTISSTHFICADPKHALEVINAGSRVYNSLLDVCVWIKNSSARGSLYRSGHELIFVFRKDKEQRGRKVQRGRHSRLRSNVWEYPSRSAETGDERKVALARTGKPVALIADALKDCSARGDLVLDPFLGSGATLLAAERTGRCCYGIEIAASCVDIAIQRWQRSTGGHAINMASGKRFAEIGRENPER